MNRRELMIRIKMWKQEYLGEDTPTLAEARAEELLKWSLHHLSERKRNGDRVKE